MYKPYILDETADYAVIYKPPRMHTAPLRPDEPGTLLNWYAALFPPILDILGRRPLEGGVLHRLDYATHGLVLFAKTQSAMDILRTQQEGGLFLKEYGALSAANVSGTKLPGFPPINTILNPINNTIESAFRPYGQGRKGVRPVIISQDGDPEKKRDIGLDRGYPYKTEILERIALGEYLYFSLRIIRGFRHQIRCHLAWIGYPILNDWLYGGFCPDGPPAGGGPPEDPSLFQADLALRAQGLFFYDPASQEPRGYSIPPIKDTPLINSD